MLSETHDLAPSNPSPSSHPKCTCKLCLRVLKRSRKRSRSPLVVFRSSLLTRKDDLSATVTTPFFYGKVIPELSHKLPLLVDATVEKKTTKNVVEYFPALARCGNFCLVSSYRRKLCAKRHQAGRQASSGLNPYCLLPHWLRSKKSREEKRNYQIVDEIRSRTLGTRLVETPSATGILHMNSLICNSTYSFCTGFEFSLYSFRLFPH